MKCVLQRMIEDPMSEMILKGEIRNGEDHHRANDSRKSYLEGVPTD